MAAVDVDVVHEDAVLSLFIIPLDKENMHLAVINLDRESATASSVNIIDEDFAQSMAKSLAALKLLALKEMIHCVIIVSSKNNSFIAGADIKYELRMKDEQK